MGGRQLAARPGMIDNRNRKMNKHSSSPQEALNLVDFCLD